MKRSLLLSLFLSAGILVEAQSFSGGVRTGLSYWQPLRIKHEFNEPYYDKIASKPFVTWDKGIFGRYESKRRFATEISFNHFSFDTKKWAGYYRWPSDVIYIGPPSTETVTDDRKGHLIELSMAFQYALKTKNSKIKAYIGPQLTYAGYLELFHYSYRIIATGEIKNDNGVRFNAPLWGVGTNYLLQYQLDKHWSLKTQGSASFTESNIPDAPPFAHVRYWMRYSVQAGIGYRF